MDFIKEFIQYKNTAQGMKKETLAVYKKDIEDFFKFSNKNFLDIVQRDILEYIEQLKKTYNGNSINRKISSLRIFFKYLFQKRLIDKIPTEGINSEKVGEIKNIALEEWEINQLLDVESKSLKDIRDKLVINLLLETGFSINEVLKIGINELELASYKYIIKFETDEAKEISEELKEKIKLYVEKQRVELSGDVKSNLLFYGLTRQGFRARVKNLAKRAGIEREISTSMIRNKVKENKKIEKKEKSPFFRENIRKKYFEIGIGDD